MLAPPSPPPLPLQGEGQGREGQGDWPRSPPRRRRIEVVLTSLSGEVTRVRADSWEEGRDMKDRLLNILPQTRGKHHLTPDHMELRVRDKMEVEVHDYDCLGEYMDDASSTLELMVMVKQFEMIIKVVVPPELGGGGMFEVGMDAVDDADDMRDRVAEELSIAREMLDEYAFEERCGDCAWQAADGQAFTHQGIGEADVLYLAPRG